MDVVKNALNGLIDLYKKRTDPVAKQYQAGNFRGLRDLLHRAALLARSEGSHSIINETHVDFAIRHGTLQAEITNDVSDELHLRDVYRKAFEDKGLQVPKNFNAGHIKDHCKNHPEIAACAFIECNLAERTSGNSTKKDYEITEIAKRLGLGRGYWVGEDEKQRLLSTESVRLAAMKFYQYPSTQKKQKPKEIIKVIRKIRATEAAQVKPAGRD